MSLSNALWFKLKALRKSRIALAPQVLLSANGASQVSAGIGQTLETRRVCFNTREDLLPSSWALIITLGMGMLLHHALAPKVTLQWSGYVSKVCGRSSRPVRESRNDTMPSTQLRQGTGSADRVATRAEEA